jgi:putative ABC transport system permease protein
VNKVNTKSSKPPKLPLRFFHWYCHPKLLKYIEGDLMELYEERVKRIGKFKADSRFIIDVLLLFRPSIIKPAEGYKNLNTYGMYKSYFKIGWRNLVRNKNYAIINVAGLALSMTCAILIFSLVKHHLNFDKFHSNTERIYRIVVELHRDVIAYQSNLPSPLGGYFRNDHTSGEKVARVFTDQNVLITIKKGDELIKFTEPDGLAFIESEFFEIFNFPMLRGSHSTALREANTAILTETAARKYFGDADPVGEVFWLANKLTFTITGVLKDLPTNTDFNAQIYVSYASLKSYDPWLAHDVDGWGGIRDGMKCYTLLKPGIQPAQVEEALQPYVKRFRPNSKNVHHYKLQPLADVHFNAQYGGAMDKGKLWTLSIIGLFLLITACLNFINLATSQALKRSKEVGVRKVLGSLKRQLFWQFITETAIIATLGIFFAITLASLLVPYANALLNIRIPLNLFADGITVAFGLALGAIITILAGYYPALILSGFQPVAALKGKLSQHSIGGFNVRRTLIITQFVISQVLIIGMIVVMNQMRFVKQSDLGFDKEAIVMIDMGIDSTRTKANIVKNEISRLPGIEKISLCSAAPASAHGWGNSIQFDGSQEQVNFRTSIKLVDADYFSTFNLSLVAGRALTPSDTAKEMVVNEAMIRKLNLSSPEDAIGKIIAANSGSMTAPIVGVVKDFHDQSFHEDISPILLTTSIYDYSSYAVKLSLEDARSTLAAIEKIWLQQHPDQLFTYEFLDDHIAHFYDAEETMLNSIQVFSFVAIFIGCMGLYGLVSFMVAHKTKEVGIRKILGGSMTDIHWIFSKEFIQLILIAAMVAIPIGWWSMQNWLQGFEFQAPITVWTFVMAILGTVFIAACTVSYMVVKGAMTNPVNSLRSE